MKELSSFEGLKCANCGIALEGEFCHGCGQSVHSVLKPMHAMGEEAFETLFHIDGRIVHTLPALLLKPGFLTLEYFSGRRVRYIAPFRLMFVLSLLTFFVLHLAADAIARKNTDLSGIQLNTQLQDFKQAKTPADVREQMQGGLEALEATRMVGNAASILKVDQNELTLKQMASKRLVELGAAPMSAASINAAPRPATVSSSATADDDEADPPHSHGIDAIERHMPPRIQVAWLPDMVNDRLTAMATHFVNNWHAIKNGDPAARAEAKERLISGIFSELPPVLFVLIPVFAALLTLFYVFKRRLFMENLITALHSHAFLFLSLLLITVVGLLSTWLRPHFALGASALNWLETAMIVWIPVYLLIMQKRVYRQGWPMTLVKYWFIGWFYFWMLMCALIVATLLGIAH